MILVATCAADAAPPTPWACRPFHAGSLTGLRSPLELAGLTASNPTKIN